jgi:hypothetical protein
MSTYIVQNNSGVTIWWKDTLWNSGDLAPGDRRTVETDHDADVKMFGKYAGDDHPWGRVWIPMGGVIEVRGPWSWDIGPQRPGDSGAKAEQVEKSIET